MGVLVLHGFTGNPEEMRGVAEAAANAGYSVELPRLPGHGTSVEDLMTTTWDDWSHHAAATYEELAARCDKVAVVGLSMGGGLAMHVAEHHPDVAGLVLINPFVKPPATELVDGAHELLAAGLETTEGIGSDIKNGKRTAEYLSTPLRPALTLFDGITHVYNSLGLVSAPILVLSSREDHVVPSDNSDAVEDLTKGPVERIWLEDSYHVATLDNDAALIESLTVRFLAGVLV